MRNHEMKRGTYLIQQNLKQLEMVQQVEAPVDLDNWLGKLGHRTHHKHKRTYAKSSYIYKYRQTQYMLCNVFRLQSIQPQTLDPKHRLYIKNDPQGLEQQSQELEQLH